MLIQAGIAIVIALVALAVSSGGGAAALLDPVGGGTMTAGAVAAEAAVVADGAIIASATTLSIAAEASALSAGASIAESAGNGGLNKGKQGNNSNSSTKVTSNLGNEIDITPSNNHTTVTKNPGPKGIPDSSVDILDKQGNVVTRRWFDSNGNAYRDVDMTNHGNPKMHPEWPHEHIWRYGVDGKPIGR